MKLLTYIMFFVAVLFSSNSFAECKSGGKTYDEGDRVGPLVCERGRWVRR